MLVMSSLFALGACSDDAPSSDDLTSTDVTTGESRAAGRFDSVHHIVLDNIANQGFETITVFAHLCPADDQECPNGEEDIAPVAARHLIPGTIYLSSSEVFVEPPDRCLDADMACRISIVRCEFASRADQLEAGFCVPTANDIAATATSALDRGSTNSCIDRREERSHHIDHGCVLDRFNLATDTKS